MLRAISLLSTICSVFVVSWLLTRLNSPLNCINSSLVEKIVIYDAKPIETVVLEKCSMQSRLFSSPAPELVRKADLFRRIERLETVASYLDFSDIPLTVHIVNTTKTELRIDGATVSTSFDVLEKPGQLEKTLLFMKLNNNNPMSAAVMADFLWEELVAREELRNRVVSWPQYFRSLHDYCKSDDVMPLHFQFCETHNALADSYIIDSESDTSAASWAMKPLYVEVLRKLYRSLDMLDKIKMLDRLIFLGEIGDEFIEVSGSQKNIYQLDESYAQMLRDWLSPLLLPQEKIENLITAQLFKSQSAINFLIVGRTSRDVFSFEYSSLAPEAIKEPLIVQYGTKKYFYPNHLPMKIERTELFAKKQVKHFVFVSCELPEVQNLLDYEGLTQTIIYVRQCEPDDVDWGLVARNGLSSYLKNNLEVQFVEFNLNALRLAERVRGPLKETENFTSWQKWLLWQKIERDDSGSLVQRPVSAIDGVSRFRIF